MAAPIPLRSDFTAGALRAVAKRTPDASQVRRLLALAAIYDGASRSEAAVPLRQLALEPRLRLLRRHRQSLLRRMKPPHRSTLHPHVHRNPGLGP